jgi:UDP-N-acetyl-D-mannosaminuronic acid dehydrogenase
MKAPAYDVCVIGGLGHVGLPLGISLAAAGKRVAVYDINHKAIETVSQGVVPFVEHGAEAVLRKVLGKTLFVTGDRSAISRAHYVVVVIGTPVDEHLNPKFSIFRKFFDGIADTLRDGQHVILRSTVFPGTTEWTKGYFDRLGKRLMLSFCPERIAQGYAMDELHSLPQIISSFDSASRKDAARLFSCLTKDIVHLEPEEAELAKLFTNVWRYIHFAIANQFYQIASQRGLDFYRIHKAITFNYPRARNFPKAGFAAGPCLFKDTMQLATYSNNSFFLGHAAMLINEGMPNLLVQMLKSRFGLKQKTVGVLGMAFKADNDDNRQSLSYKLKKILEIEAGEVLCSDVYIKDPTFVSAQELLRKCDIIVLATPHKEYRSLRLPPGKIMLDMWDFYGKGGLVQAKAAKAKAPKAAAGTLTQAIARARASKPAGQPQARA